MNRYLVAVVGMASLVLAAGSVSAEQIDKKSFNFNVPQCPQPAQYSGLSTVSVDKFTDGSPLPSCGGAQGSTHFKMVWTGKAWAKYGPSVTAVTPPAPSKPAILPPIKPDYPKSGQKLPDAPALSSLPSRVQNGVTQYLVTGAWYRVSQVIAQGGGNVIAQGGGNVIAQGGGNIYVLSKVISNDAATAARKR